MTIIISRAILFIILTIIFIPVHIIITIYAIALAIYAKIEYGLTFKESWEAYKEGLKKRHEDNIYFIKTGNFDGEP